MFLQFRFEDLSTIEGFPRFRIPGGPLLNSEEEREEDGGKLLCFSLSKHKGRGGTCVGKVKNNFHF
jgi:hypothetical protein